MRKGMRKWAVIAGAVVLAAIIAMLLARPQQEPLPEEFLQQKAAGEQAYLDFIAQNLVSGGVGNDDIPAIDNPRYLSAHEAALDPQERVFGVNRNGFVAAYPQSILYWHEIVNDGEEQISVTYCPLTGSVIGYSGKNLGVSGKLYNSNLVMYDRETDSLYPQMLGKAVAGDEKGERLESFPIAVVTWKEWLRAHPDTLVLSENTGYSKEYASNPYPGYDDALRVWFPLAARSDKFHSKRIVHGIEHDGKAYAVLPEAVNGSLRIENTSLTVESTAEGALSVRSDEGKAPLHYDAFWFAWYAYHPDTIVIEN